MTISAWLTITAIIIGPILAVQVQKKIERWRQERERKIWVFKSLMATRGIPLSPRHVESLNMIDLEFSEKISKEKPVVDAWRVYHDHLYGVPRDYKDPNYQSLMNIWNDKKQELFTKLLFAMSQALGYTFDEVRLKKGFYTPQGQADLENELLLLRRGILDALYLRKPIPVELIETQKPPSDQITESQSGKMISGTILPGKGLPGGEGG